MNDNPAISVIPDCWPRQPAYVAVTSTSTALSPPSAWAYAAPPVRYESSFTGSASQGNTVYQLTQDYSCPVAYLIGDRFHIDTLTDIVLVEGDVLILGIRSAQATDRRARALETLRSWLAVDDSDDQAASFRQLKEDLKESRRGQRQLFRD